MNTGHLGRNLFLAGSLAAERKFHLWPGKAAPRAWAAEFLAMSRDPEAWAGLAPERAQAARRMSETVAWLFNLGPLPEHLREPALRLG